MAIKSSLCILLADDEEIVHKTVAGYLRDSGHSVDMAHDRPAALEAIRTRDYDLVLADLRMPVMGGLPLLSEMREIRPEMSVVIIIEQGDMDMAIQALRLGAVDFLKKPIKLLELDAVLEKSVRARKLIAQHTQIMNVLRRTREEFQERFREQTAESAKINEKLQIEIAERKRAEKALQESEGQCRLLAENVADVIWITDMDLRSTYVNSAVTRMLGYEVEEVMALTQEEILTPASLEVIRGILAEELAIQSTDQKALSRLRAVEVEMVRKDDSTIRVKTKYAFLRDLDGRPVGILGILSNITDNDRSLY